MAEKKQAKPIFYSLFKNLEKEAKLGNFDKLSPTKIKYLSSYINKHFNAYQRKRLASLIKGSSAYMRRFYRNYITKDFKINNANIGIQSIKRIQPKLEKVFKARNADSINLITTQSPESLALIKNRLWNWIRAKGDKSKLNSQSLRDSVKASEIIRKQNKHFAMILKDQTHKMRGNLDLTIAENLGAIGFIWQTREDLRVVGNPAGFYKPSDITKKQESIHGNHFKRNGKLYFYHNTWAIKQRLINTKAQGFEWADFADGMPSIPINCRCYAENIYTLDKIPKKFRTEAGEKYIKENDLGLLD